MNYKHFTIRERITLEIYLQNGYSQTRCAIDLNKSEASISREIACCKKGKYEGLTAQKIYDTNKKSGGLKKHLTFAQKNYIKKSLENLWSPDEMINRFPHLSNFDKSSLGFQTGDNELGKSVSTLYRYINNRKFGLKPTNLRHNRSHKKHGKTFHKFNSDKKHVSQIERNPLELGHFEADLIIGKNGKSQKLTVTDRYSNLDYIVHLDPKLSDEVYDKLFEYMNHSSIKHMLKSLTLDNGSEFAQWKKLEEVLEIPVYFAKPHSLWEKGTIEHENKLIRQRCPKKQDLNKYKKEYDKETMNLLNNRPRKKLGYLTPLEIIRQSYPHFSMP